MDRSPAWNRRAAGSRSGYKERRSDVKRGGRPAPPARSHSTRRLPSSSVRSRPRHPAKGWAACSPRERADANGRTDAERLRPKRSVLRSNSSVPHSGHLFASGSASIVGTSLHGGGRLATRQSLRLEHPFVAECRLLVGLLFFTRVIRLLVLARSPIFGHSRSSQVVEQKAGLSPSVVRVREVYYTLFPGANICWSKCKKNQNPQ